MESHTANDMLGLKSQTIVQKQGSPVSDSRQRHIRHAGHVGGF